MKEEFQKLFEKFDKTLSIAEKNMLHEYTTALKDLYDITAKAYRKYEKNGKLTYEEMTRYNRINSFYAQLDEAVNQAYKNNTKIISNSLKDTYKTGYNGVKNIVETYTEKNGKKYLIPIVKDEVLEKSMNNNISGLKWTERMGLHRDTAVLKIRETVTQGLKKGQTYGEMSRDLNDSLSGQVVQPMRIVRTESHRVFSEAKKDSLDVVAKKGLKMTKTWISSRDERVRAQHAAMDSVTIPYEDDFIMPDGAKGFGPGMIGAPQHDIHCRCDWIIDFMDSVLEEHYEENVENEPDITEDIKNIVGENGGKLEGLGHRVKEFPSFERKATQEIAEVKDVNKSLNKMYDIIRYTSIKDSSNLTEHYFSVIDELENKGYNIVRVKNSWGDEDTPYKGINVIVNSPKGQKFELQFHTPESFDTKENKQHKLYEEQRLATTTIERKKELKDRMFELANSLNVPKDVDKIKSFNKLGGV